MYRPRLHTALLAVGTLLVTSGGLVADNCGGCGPAPCGGCGTGCAPAPMYQTVTCVEYVQEQVPMQVTRYQMQSKEETYTAYRVETTPEQKTRTWTVYRCEMVPVQQTRNYTVLVPHTETVNVNVTRYVTTPVTEQKTFTAVRCVPKTYSETRKVTVCEGGHYEAMQVPCAPTYSVGYAGGCGGGCEGGRHRLCGGRRHHGCGGCEMSCGGCGDACGGGGDACGGCGPTMTTVQRWVPNYVTKDVPYTWTRMEQETYNYTANVTTYRCDARQESVPVTRTVCVSEQRSQNYTCYTQRVTPEQKTENYTVYNCKTVPYQATRTVAVCVPVQQTITVARCVPRYVQKQVPVMSCGGCDMGGGSDCGSGCGGGHSRHRMCGGRRHTCGGC